MAFGTVINSFTDNPNLKKLAGEEIIECPPYYDGYTLDVSISGSYSDATYNYAYSFSESWNVARVAMRDYAINADFAGNYGFAGTFDIAAGDDSALDPETETFMRMNKFLVQRDGAAPVVPFAPPSPLGFTVSRTVGTRTNLVGPPNPTNITASIQFLAFALVHGSNSLPDALEFYLIAGPGVIVSEDTTAYTAADWRDVTGIRSGSEVDSNGITWSFTFEI